ncbi:MAG: hypothetical protein AAGB12_16865, partial [Pseudomonadota bacterium]
EDLRYQYELINPRDKWLHQYITRIKTVMKDFKRYQLNPTSLTPRATLSSLMDMKVDTETHPVFQYKLRKNLQISISGIPLDFTINECKKLQKLLEVYVNETSGG